MFWWFDWAPTKWPLVPGRTNFVMEIQLGLWEGLFCMRFFQWWYLFWVSFFGKHLRRLSLVSDGGDGWLHFTSMLLPDRVCLVSYPQMLKTTGGRRGMTRNDKDEGCCYPTPQATNKRLDAFLPLQLGKKRNQFWPQINEKTQANVPRNPKQRFSQVDSTNVPNPQHMEAHCGTQSKTSKNSHVCHPKTFNFPSPQKNSWLFPAPWNKYCQTSKVPLSMVHQSQIDPNCICPQYEHPDNATMSLSLKPWASSRKKMLTVVFLLLWTEVYSYFVLRRTEGWRGQIPIRGAELQSKSKLKTNNFNDDTSKKLVRKCLEKQQIIPHDIPIFFQRLGMKNLSKMINAFCLHRAGRPTSRVWPSDGRCFPCNNPVVPKNTVDGRNPANQLRLVVYPIIFRLLYIPGGAGFLPSTVLAWYLLNTLCWYRLLGYLFPTTTHIFYRFSHWRISSIP